MKTITIFPVLFLSLAQSLIAFHNGPNGHLLADLSQWEGVTIESPLREVPVGEVTRSGSISYTYPDGEKGWYKIGLSSVHDGSGNWKNLYGVRLEVYLESEMDVIADATIHTVPIKQGSQYVVEKFSSKVGVSGKGWHSITFPIQSFNYEKARPTILEAIKTFELNLQSLDDKQPGFRVRNPRLVMADRVHFESPVRSASAKGGEDVIYTLNLTNCTDDNQVVTLSRIIQGREVMETTISPSEIILAPGGKKTAEVKVTVSERVTAGGRESQLIQVMANGSDAGQIEYITLSKMEHPYVLHTPERWNDVLQKVEDVEWAQEAAQRYIDRAEAWVVPEVDEEKISTWTHTPYLFLSRTNNDFYTAAIAYKLTGERKYADKAALFLNRIADPQKGYPRTYQLNENNLVKEGAYFQYIAMGYDMIYDSGAFTEEDHANIEKTFRLFHKVIDQHISSYTMGNWQVAELLGCIYTALVIQDMAVVERFVEGPGGFYDQLTHGVMSDGWWFECSIGYNAWVAREFTQFALAMQPWGVDYQYASFPASYSTEYNLVAGDVEQRKRDYYGMPFQKWGPVAKPYVKITDMWDAMIPYIDYEGVMFAINDSTENKFEGMDYEVAYFVYRDPSYASIIKNNSKRDLLYGVAELPEDTPELGHGSAYSDNVGVSMLRSKAEGKHPREKIQAVLKYGTHGGYHGHFDRASLNSLMRYGRSFYNPEHVWYSYPNFMYKFFVQSSLPHNMVVVDMKQQEPVESSRILYSEGDLLQATAVETNARWTNPPYGGIYYPNFQIPFQEKSWLEGRYVPQPENEPKYGSVGGYSERVKQRRLLAVADEYVIVADYLQSPGEHTFDCLFNIKGFQGIEADSVTLNRHTESMNPDPILAAQFITDCNWYDAKGTAKVSFETQFGPDADNAGTRIHGTDGVLKMDVYSAWPTDREIMIGALPEAHWVNRQFWYSVHGDGELLDEGKFGAWVLGRDEINVSIEGLQKLTLSTKADYRESERDKTLFWAEPVIVTADGTEIPLSSLDLSYDQIDTSAEHGQDYYGGPLKISGREFSYGVPANPVGSGIEGTVTVDLTGLNAVRFKSHVGGDYPLGDETWRRKSLSFRTDGSEAEYLTVIEPYESEPVVKSVTATSSTELTVELNDGRTHEIKILNLDDGESVQVHIQEYSDGKFIREELLHN